VQISAFSTTLHINCIERKPESLTAAVLQERALKAIVQDTEGDFIVDIIGTGRDGFNLFNISMTAVVIAAGAGAHIIKVSEQLSTTILSGYLAHSTAVGHPHCPQALPTSFSPSTVSSQPQLLDLQCPSPMFPSHSY